MKINQIKVRKDHLCDVCNEEIKKSEICTVVSLLPGDWLYMEDRDSSPYQTFYRHNSCEEAYSWLVDYIDDIETLPYGVDGGVYNSGIFDILEDYADDIITSSTYLHESEEKKSDILSLLKKAGFCEVGNE